MRDILGYEGKTCVVTGAASGMGGACARTLVELGAEVIGLDGSLVDPAGIDYATPLAIQVDPSVGGSQIHATRVEVLEPDDRPNQPDVWYQLWDGYTDGILRTLEPDSRAMAHDASVSFGDGEPATIADIAGLDGQFGGTPIYSIAVDAPRQRHHLIYGYGINPDAEGFLFPMQEFLINGSAYDVGAWRKSRRYLPGTTLDSTADVGQ